MHNHPYVSEAHEGKPWFEWCVLRRRRRHHTAGCFRIYDAATVILAVTAIITGLVRLILQDRSPWKVRSVAFDSFIGIALGLGLLITLLQLLWTLRQHLFPLNRHQTRRPDRRIRHRRACPRLHRHPSAEDRRQPALWEWSSICAMIMTNATTAAAKTGLIQNTHSCCSGFCVRPHSSRPVRCRWNGRD